MPTIGEKLKQAREARKLSLKQTVQAVRIRAHYLQAMEENDFESLPSPVQARGFLRLYADFLGLNGEELLEEMETGIPAEKKAEEAAPAAFIPAPQAPAPLPTPPPPPQPAAQQTESPPSASQTIFLEIGTTLQARRELLGLTLEEIERHTHIRKNSLQHIEAGDFEALASPVQARGMLGGYANFLDMNVEATLLRFAEAIQARRLERQPQPVRRTPNPAIRLPAWLPHLLSPDLLFGSVMALLIAGMVIWGASRMIGSPSETDAALTEQPSLSEALLATPEGGISPTPEIFPTSVEQLGTAIPTQDPVLLPPTETATPFFFEATGAVQVTVIAMERVYLRVLVDGVVEQEGRIAPGAALTFDGAERIEVVAGSGAGIRIVYNQIDLGVQGGFGEVINLIYTVDGVQTPTPPPSTTPTATPRGLPSPTATLTPFQTLTPIP